MCQGKKLIYKFITIINVKLNEKLFSSEIPCPGGDTPCDGHGQCDLTSGECSCEAGRHGFDCSSNIWIVSNGCCLSFCNFLFFVSLEFDCPGDGTCSNQGTCDDTTGTCVCFQGFERISGICKGMYSVFIFSSVFKKNNILFIIYYISFL